MMSRTPVPALPVLLAGLLLGFALPAAAQTDAPPASTGGMKWTLLDAVGYGGLGFGLGLVAAADMEGDDIGPPGSALAVLGATTAAGFVAGAVIGRRAQNRIAEGRPVEGAHRAAVNGGVVMAGAILGTLAAIPLVNSEGEGTPLGSDEQTVGLMALVGGGLGSLYAWRHSGELSPRTISVAPAISGTAGYGMRLRMSF